MTAPCRGSAYALASLCVSFWANLYGLYRDMKGGFRFLSNYRLAVRICSRREFLPRKRFPHD